MSCAGWIESEVAVGPSPAQLQNPCTAATRSKRPILPRYAIHRLPEAGEGRPGKPIASQGPAANIRFTAAPAIASTNFRQGAESHSRTFTAKPHSPTDMLGRPAQVSILTLEQIHHDPEEIPSFPAHSRRTPALGGSDDDCVRYFTPFLSIFPSPVGPPAFQTSFSQNASSCQALHY